MVWYQSRTGRQVYNREQKGTESMAGRAALKVGKIDFRKRCLDRRQMKKDAQAGTSRNINARGPRVKTEIVLIFRGKREKSLPGSGPICYSTSCVQGRNLDEVGARADRDGSHDRRALNPQCQQ
jgi:hypothetical protein